MSTPESGQPNTSHLTEHAGQAATGREVAVTLTVDEISYVLEELHGQGHGHGSKADDFEIECPACTAADKFAAAIAAATGSQP